MVKTPQKKRLSEIEEETNKLLVEIFGKDLPEGTNIYSKDK